MVYGREWRLLGAILIESAKGVRDMWRWEEDYNEMVRKVVVRTWPYN